MGNTKLLIPECALYLRRIRIRISIRKVPYMGELSKLPNIGKTVELQLIQMGIETPEALRENGAKAAWLKIQEIDPSACIHR